MSRLYLTRGRSDDAVRILRIGAANLPDNVHVLELLARVLATSQHDALRDGATAVTLAERGSKLTGGREPVIESTLAAAYAEMGNFERAVVVARRALDLVQPAASGQNLTGETIRLQLERYVQQKPYRDPGF